MASTDPAPVPTWRARRRAGLRARGAARPALLVASALMTIAVAAFVAINAGRRGAGDAPEVLGDGGIEPVRPDADDLARASEQPSLEVIPSMPEGQGGWYQASDERGRLAQQYRFTYLDPTPPGKPPNWALMTRPEAEIFSEGRVIRLESESALVYLPNRALESGTLTGSVVIRVYEISERRSPRVGRDRPALVIRTAQADYDDMLGAVRCPGDFEVETARGEFHGSGLTLLVRGGGALPDVNVPGKVHGRLAMAGDSGGRAQRARRAPVAAAEPGPQVAEPSAPQAAGSGVASGGERFYLVRLPEDVLISQGEGDQARSARGDLLELIFSPRSEALDPGGAEEPAPAAAPDATRAPAPAPAPAADAPAVSAVAASDRLAPPPAPDDIHITCSGGLTMTALGDPARRPVADADALVEMTGAPLELLDAAQGAKVTCARLAWHALARELELLSSPQHPLAVESPRLSALGERFWLRPDSRRGGFSGAGSITGAGGIAGAGEAEGADRAGADPAATPEGFRIAWKQAVELFFGEAGGSAGSSEGAGALGPLERAEFLEAVEVVRGDVRVWSDRAEAHFRPAPDSGGAGVELDRFNASGSVQALLSRGGRIFADDVSGNAAGGEIEVTGADVMVVMDRWVIDGGRRISGSESEESIHWEGPGRAQLFAAPQEPATQGPIDRPAPGSHAQLVATWDSAMDYGRDPEAIRLRGGVRVLSTPSPLERGTVEADEVTLHLVAPPEAAPEGRMEVGRVVASGDAPGGARLEHLAFDDPAMDQPARLFYLESQRIEYDQRSGDALVPGPGILLFRDQRPQEQTVPEADGGEVAGSSPWGRGTISFSWQRRLVMTRRDGGPLYDLDMEDGVEMRHLDLAGAVSTLSCRRASAVLERPEAGLAGAPGGVLAAGSAELVSVHAEGTIFLRTPQRDVDADIFDHDLRTGVARIRALPGNTVTIFTAGQPQPVHVREATWNLVTDEIEVIRGRGGGARP